MRLVHPPVIDPPSPTAARRVNPAARFARSALWSLLVWIAQRRRARISSAELLRCEFPHQSRGRGWQLSNWLRDRLRPRWLRLRREPRALAAATPDSPHVEPGSGAPS